MDRVHILITEADRVSACGSNESKARWCEVDDSSSSLPDHN
jgi:hypothetical protein